MGVLTNQNVDWVYHFTPLHYLPFIARAQKIMSKPTLAAAGFQMDHFRSKSKRQDIKRGFGDYVHMTLESWLPMICAKLKAGFPHVGLAIPASAVDEADYSLCRYNVAMTHSLRRDGKPGYREAPGNGKYYLGHQIPIACTPEDKNAMLSNRPKNSMIEVLIGGEFRLPRDTCVVSYSQPDCELVKMVLSEFKLPWTLKMITHPSPYPRNATYAGAVAGFVKKALLDPEWKGNGLEFDHL